MLSYSQSSGVFKRDGVIIAKGYAGFQDGKNDPSDEKRPAIGPIPKGKWSLVEMRDSVNTGPHTIVLEPCEGTKTFGRSAFRIHGDSIKNPGNASHGCIILPRQARLNIWRSGDRELLVTE